MAQVGTDYQSSFVQCNPVNVQIRKRSFFTDVCNKVAEFLAIIDTGSTTTVAGQVAAETEIRHTTGKQVHLAVATQQAEVAAGIMVITGIVHTIRKHVIAQQTLAGGNEYVGVEEPAPFGVIIPALEIIEPGLIYTLLAAEANLPLIKAYCLGRNGPLFP